jgi:hypothetical protein
MDDQRIGVVRLTYEAWNEHGPGAIGPMLTDDVELHDAPELPDAEVWRGRKAVIARLKAVTDAIGGGSVSLQEFSPADDAVLVGMQWQLRSGEGELGSVFHLVEVEAGRISRIRVFLTRSEALLAP